MNTMSKRARAIATLTAAATLSLIMPAFAQAPTDAQRSAIRSACRNDYMAHCSSVTPGGLEALQCLQKNMSSLAPGCQSAVRAVEPAAEPKAEAKPEAKPEEKPAAEAKPEAKPEAPAAAPAEKPAAETAAKPAPKAAAAPAAAPAGKATDAQRAAIRSACRNDYMANCSSVTPGGAGGGEVPGAARGQAFAEMQGSRQRRRGRRCPGGRRRSRGCGNGGARRRARRCAAWCCGRCCRARHCSCCDRAAAWMRARYARACRPVAAACWNAWRRSPLHSRRIACARCRPTRDRGAVCTTTAVSTMTCRWTGHKGEGSCVSP